MKPRVLTASLLQTALLAGLATAASGQVDSANDVCSPGDDPCVISSEFVVANGAILDFGSREVRIIGAGKLDFGSGHATIVCGELTVNAGDEVVLKVRGPNGFGDTDGGNLSIRAERSCSGNAAGKCINNLDCSFGSCSLKLCAEDPTRTCTSDESCTAGSCSATVCSAGGRLCGVDDDCSVGPCNFASRSCAGDSNVRCFSDFECNFGTCQQGDPRCSGDISVSCSGDGDCDFGACDVDVCAQADAQGFRQCSSDADCDDGQCSIGTGNILINSRTRADGSSAGQVEIRAAGDLTLNNFINANGNDSASDGGIIELEAGTGNLSVNDMLQVAGGGIAQGGEIGLSAGGDIRVNAPLNLTGGDFDGGIVEMLSDGSVFILAGIDADSTSGEGFGGEISVSAGGDITVTGNIVLKTNGHQSAVNDAGDGGPQDYSAAGNVSIGPSVQLVGNGAKPYGFGDEIALESEEQNVTVAGSVISSTNGTLGGGGTIGISAAGNVSITATGILDATGSAEGGGTIDVFGGRDVVIDGVVDAAADNGGTAESVGVDAGRDVTIGGHLRIGVGAEILGGGSITVDGCSVTVENGGWIESYGDFSQNLFSVGDLMTVAAGGTVSADPVTGENDLQINPGGPGPVVLGSVVPEFFVSESATPRDCAECGDGKREGSESCDDGNSLNGDGCSDDCQLESCIAATPGYPEVPICDDANGCTIDVCNPDTGECDHAPGCGDGVDCTVDTCVDGTCVNTPDDAQCDDGSVCTDDLCGMTGCAYAGNFDPCDDGLACTANDHCNGQGTCRGDIACDPGEECSPASGECVPEGAVCGDSVVDPGESCDDGNKLWFPGESCDRFCAFVACGDPNDDDRTTASDALFTLNSAVGVNTCDTCICDVNSSGGVTATDALRLLNFAISVPGISLTCPACE